MRHEGSIVVGLRERSGPRRAARTQVRAALWGVLVLALVAGVGGCGDGGGPTSTVGSGSGREVTKVGVVAPEEANDFGWNQEGVEAAKKLAASLGVEIEVADGAGYDDPGPVLRQLAEDGSDLLIAWASGYNAVAQQTAVELDVPVVVIGAFEQGLTPGLSQDLETRAQQGSYLAGYLAARMTKTGTLGIVMSADDENWVKMAGGFVAGARAAEPASKLLLAQIGQAGYADAAGGKRVTEGVIAAGADIVFGMGDGSSFGMIQAVETAAPPAGADKLWFIDVIGDKTSLDRKGVYLTSVWWDYQPLLERAAAALSEGTFGTEVYYLDLAGGGLKLLHTPHIPDALWTELTGVQADIVAGTIDVPVTDSKAAVEALIGG
ncbi:MAG: BMP family protein [Thermoleophilia bacterium]